jgi:hypothetical protein
MAMFTRRLLQRMLDHLAGHLPAEARIKLAHELNRQSTSALGFEWETALLFAFCHIGKVEYEASSTGGSKPDITFVEDGQNSISFAADIATISDDGLEEDNPAADLSRALMGLRKKYGLPGSTHCTIGGEAMGKCFDDRKMRLKLPPRHKIGELLKKHVAPEFKRARDEKLPTVIVTINEPGIEVAIRYDATQRYGGLSYPSFRETYSLTRNPVYSKLKAKAKQLKASGLSHSFGIFLCDGDCALLKRTQKAPTSFSIADIIREFFRQTTSVSFICILTFPLEFPAPFFGAPKRLQIDLQLYTNQRANRLMDKNALRSTICRALTHVPAPLATAHDALHWIKTSDPNEGIPIHNLTHGGSLMSSTLKISARKIQELPAGRMTPQQFFDDYARPNSPFENPFVMALKQGLTIQSVTLIKVPDADDDFLEFHFAPDAAISKFEPNKNRPVQQA